MHRSTLGTRLMNSRPRHQSRPWSRSLSRAALFILAAFWLGCSSPPPTAVPATNTPPAPPPTATATTPPPTDTSTPEPTPTATATAVPATNTPTPTATTTTPPPTPTATSTSVAPAAPTLDVTLDPNFGSTDLSAGFTPDPFQVDITSGGPVDVAALSLGENCLGFASAAPDYRVNWSGNAERLRFFFVADDDSEDATLIVNRPNNSWQCNDDSAGTLNPLVNFDNPAAGQYDIWVGSFAAEAFISGTLYVTELDLSPDELPGTLDFSLEPNFGESDLAAGFTPDPFEVDVVSGGSVDVGALNLGGDCLGFTSAAPNYRINWSGSSDELRVFFVAEDASEDATLIINDAGGNWLCNDDSSGLNPLVTINNPVAGQYDIWVGSFAADEFLNGTLFITELDLGPGDFAPVGNGNLDLSADPNFGTGDLASGFTPDPFEVDVVSGGSVDVGALNLGADCLGFASSAPDYRLNWSGTSGELRVFFKPDDAQDDTTLIVNDAAGNWHCNDDTDGLDPMVMLSDPPAGQYDIWVGSFSEGEFISGTLYVTELDLGPGDVSVPALAPPLAGLLAAKL